VIFLAHDGAYQKNGQNQATDERWSRKVQQLRRTRLTLADHYRPDEQRKRRR
jgi:hypothetical protein